MASNSTGRVAYRITSLPVKVTMLLCDAAQVADGKLYVLGGGWSLTGPDPMPSAIAMKIDVDWHEAGEVHHWELFLEDADGRPVLVETPDGIDQRVQAVADDTVDGRDRWVQRLGFLAENEPFMKLMAGQIERSHLD